MGTTQQPDTGRTPGPARAAAAAAGIEGAFGFAWFGWAQQSPPRWLVPVLVVGSVACLVVLVLGVVRRRRLGRVPGTGWDDRGRRRYWRLVGLEAVLAGAGSYVLGATGHALLVAGWVCLVVGLHFVPLARVFPGIGLVGLGLVVTTVGVLALVLAAALGLPSPTVAGAGAGVALLVHGAALLRRARRTA